ncbi:MAG: multicomponent Na+:H+ antiporter subunit E [Candidatus Pelagisphaera sp.]|jgi:multicomponent Na+:H+ antiporter subunit E
MYRLSIFLLLCGIWIVFSGQFDAFHLTLGALSAAFITAISSSFLFVDRSKGFGGRLNEIVRLPGFLLWMLYQILLSNIHILKLAFSSGEIPEVQPSLVRIKTNLKTDFGKWMLANSITLTPGTITISIEGDELLIHSISKATTEGVMDDSMERKIARIFEPESK